MGKTLGDMTPEERRAATERALDKFQAELTASAPAIGAILDAADRGELDGPPHADYPHEPGRLYDCPACESRCNCTAGYTQCIYRGDHNGSADEGSERFPTAE
jgi:hypothetical protein